MESKRNFRFQALDLDEWHELSKDEPGLHPLDVGGLGKLGRHADQQVRRCQHHRQVHRDCRVEKVRQPEVRG